MRGGGGFSKEFFEGCLMKGTRRAAVIRLVMNVGGKEEEEEKRDG